MTETPYVWVRLRWLAVRAPQGCWFAISPCEEMSVELRSGRLEITSLGMLATLWLTTWLYRGGESVCRCSVLRTCAGRCM